MRFSLRSSKLDHQELRLNCRAVGELPERGIVAEASYEAKVFGMWSAMPSETTKRFCKTLVYVKSKFDTFKSAPQYI
jgi:DNA polymerase-4